MLGVMVRNLLRAEEKRLHNGMRRQGAWRQASISAAATLALLVAEAASLSQAYAQDGSARAELTTVSIPAGSLEQGLVALGRQTNLKLVYPSALTTGKKTSGVAGRMTVKDAVEHLLAQTGLRFTVTSTGAVQISALSARDQALRAQASIPLDTINVEAAAPKANRLIRMGMVPAPAIAQAIRNKSSRLAKPERNSLIFPEACKRCRMNCSMSRAPPCCAKAWTTLAA
jgi:hypothetical protein